MTALRVGVAGIHGHGRSHVDAVRALAGDDVVLAAVADPRGAGDLVGGGDGGVAVYADAAEMIRDAPLDVVVLSTPIPTHTPLTVQALRAGRHVLLEKPPVASVADHHLVVGEARSSGRAVQVGFQSLGSAGVAATADAAAGGTIGDIEHVGAVGLWSRSEQYWRRASWAGHRVLDGRVVADGVVTNPLAHAVATALAIAGAAGPDDVAEVDADLYRANDIGTDDTSTVRIRLASGPVVLAALAVTAAQRSEPYVLVRGSRGHLIYHYTLDVLHIFGAGRLPRSYAFERVPLLRNLVDHVRTGGPLAVPIARTGAFTRVLEAVVASAPPAVIEPAHLRQVTRDGETFRVVTDVDLWAERAAWEARTFRTLAAPWTAPPSH